MSIQPHITLWYNRAIKYLRQHQTLETNTTQVATAANTNETDLWTYSLPEGTLDTDGKTLRITAWGTTAANTNSKTVKLYFAGTVIRSSTTTTSAAGWMATGVVTRTSASNAAAAGSGVFVFATEAQTLSHDPSVATTIKVTGTNGTAAANDIVFRGAIVENLN